MNKKCVIEILVTEDCNNQCLYCIQKDMHTQTYLTSEKTKDIFNFIDKFKKEHKEIDSIDLMLFGGEPLLNEEVCNKILDYALENNHGVIMITNGFLIHKYIDKFKLLSKNNLISSLQISYDGNPIHDLYRCNSSKKVLEAIQLCKENNLQNLCIKSTLPIDGFKYLYECYIDCIENLDMNYVPTIDYSYNSLKDIDNYVDVFKEQLFKIAKYCVKNKMQDPRTDLLSLNGKILCSAGNYYFAINSDLNVSRCHQTCFSDESCNECHVIGNINDDDINKKINNMFNLHDIVNRNITGNSECDNCDVTLCKKCCANNYNYSDKDSYTDKWYDKNVDNLCNLYKMISKISKSYNYIMQNS